MPELLLAVNTPVVVVSFSLYTLVIVAIGLYSARFARRSDEDYFLAGRSLGPWVGALSASASSESGWVTLGLVGWAFAYGVQAYWIIPGCLLGYLFNWFVLAGRMSERAKALGALTLPDFLAFRFRERVPLVRFLSVLVILVAMLLYVAAQLSAAGKAFSTAFAGLDYSYGVLIGTSIVLVYTVSGGFRAVCWTDFLQALLMVGTLIVFPIYLLFAHGGYAFVSAQLAPAIPEGGQPGDLMRFIPNVAGPALLGFLLGHGALGINFGYPGQPHVLVRFLALRNRKDARVAGVIAFTWGLFVYWGAVTIGLFARAMAEAGETWAAVITEDSEVSLVVSAMELLPGVVSGLVLAAILAAICSTADSQLVVAASSAANDLFARMKREALPRAIPDTLRVSLATLATLSAIAFTGAFVFGDVLAFLGVALGITLLLGLYTGARWAYVLALLSAALGIALALGLCAPYGWAHVLTLLSGISGIIDVLRFARPLEVAGFALIVSALLVVPMIISSAYFWYRPEPRRAGVRSCPACGRSLLDSEEPRCARCGHELAADSITRDHETSTEAQVPAEPSPIVGAHPWVNRIVVATLGLFAMRLVFETRVKVYEYVLTYGWAILGAAFGPQVILALFWKRASWAGCLAGMLTGFLIALIWPNVYDEAATGVHVYNLPLAFVAALIVNIVVSLVVPGPARAEARS